MSTATDNLKTIASHDREDRFVRINLNELFVDRDENVRNNDAYSEEAIEELCDQIEAVDGLLQPIGICPIEATPETKNREWGLVYGFRRVTALLQLAKDDKHWLEDVPALIVEPGDHSTAKMVQLIENLARKDLTPMEIARGIEEALSDEEVKLKQKDVAKILCMSTAAVSQHRKLLKLPKAVQALLETPALDEKGEPTGKMKLSFSHARKLQELVPEDEWEKYAEIGTQLDYGDFCKRLNAKFGSTDDGDSDDEGEGGETSSSTSSQKSAKLLRATVLRDSYIPFLKQRVKKADAEEKKFTEADVEKARLDAINTVMKQGDTELSKSIKPFMEKQKEAEEKQKKQKEAEKEKEKFFRAKIKEIRDILKAPIDPENPDAPRPNLTTAIASVVKDVKEMSDDEQKKLGFKLDLESFSKDLHEAYVEDVKAKKEAAEKRAKAQAEKEAKEKEEAEKAAKEKAEGDSDSDGEDGEDDGEGEATESEESESESDD